MALGYSPQSLSVQSEYQLNFRIINRNLSNSDPMSSEYAALLRDIQDKVWSLSPISSLLALGAPLIPLSNLHRLSDCFNTSLYPIFLSFVSFQKQRHVCLPLFPDWESEAQKRELCA